MPFEPVAGEALAVSSKGPAKSRASSLVLTCCMLVCSTAALATEVSILDTHFATDLSITTAKQIGRQTEISTSTQSSTSSTSLSKEIHGSAKVFASADANTFNVSTGTSALWDSSLNEVSAFAKASSQSIFSFNALANGFAPLTLDFDASKGQTFFSSGSISLYDTTSNQSLFLYDWSQGFVGNVPFTPSLFASVSVDPFLLSSHQYLMTMNVSTNANTDAQAASIRVSGLQQVGVVPEPETYALMLAGLLAVGIAVRRRKL
jgi:hypothetical protein